MSWEISRIRTEDLNSHNVASYQLLQYLHIMVGTTRIERVPSELQSDAQITTTYATCPLFVEAPGVEPGSPDCLMHRIRTYIPCDGATFMKNTCLFLNSFHIQDRYSAHLFTVSVELLPMVYRFPFSIKVSIIQSGA